MTVQPPDQRACLVRDGLWLDAQYTLEERGDRFTTASYRFVIQNVSTSRVMKENEWLVRWEFHPDSPPAYPHIHVHGAAPKGWDLPEPLRDVHVPASRALLEDAVEFLIDTFGAARRPRHECAQVLAANRRRFEKRSSWLLRSPAH